MSIPNIPCKWPGLLVVGDSVTREEACEINIRTSSWSYLSSNDDGFLEKIYNLIGDFKPYDFKREWDDEAYKKFRETLEGMGVLDLDYLTNQNIVSNWIGGPHGWCSWSGEILANTYNIGKWPSFTEVYEEWGRIAAAFPFLKLRSQLLTGEICEEDTIIEPCVEFVISDGTVKYIDPPGKQIISESGHGYLNFMSHECERGITIDGLKEALEITRNRMKSQR